MTETLKPCRECGAPCSVQVFPNATLWVCSHNKILKGGCPSDTAYLSAEDWNAHAPDNVAKIVDWWKPHPEDPFWMLEAEDGEWLKNAYSFLGTREATKAIRFPTERDAINHPAKSKAGYKWWAAKATEHTWITIERGDWKDKDDATSD